MLNVRENMQKKVVGSVSESTLLVIIDAGTLENKRCSIHFQDKDGGVKIHIRSVELMGNI